MTIKQMLDRAIDKVKRDGKTRVSAGHRIKIIEGIVIIKKVNLWQKEKRLHLES